MSNFSWMPGTFSRSQARLGHRPTSESRRKKARLFVEALEGRALLASYTALTVSDLITDINLSNQSGGANTITLAAPTTSPYALTAVNNTTSGGNGLPVIAASDNLTIVGNGDTIERTTPTPPYFRLLEVEPSASLTLKNLTLQGGFATGSGAGLGGAILNEGTLVLSAVTVQYNDCGVYVGNNPFNGGLGSAYGSIAAGGGIWSSGFLTLETGTVIKGNDAEAGPGVSGGETAGNGGAAFGGGLYVAGGTLNISDTTFSGNRALGGAGGWHAGVYPADDTYGAAGNAYGGALYVAAGQVTLTATTLTGNSAVGGAGGLAPQVVYNPYAFPNTGPAGSAYGGALFMAGGTVTLSDDSVESNSCQYGYQNDPSALPAVASGGGMVIAQGATVYIDAFTLAHTINNALLPRSVLRNPSQIVGKYIET
jgi:hypothetical protein